MPDASGWMKGMAALMDDETRALAPPLDAETDAEFYALRRRASTHTSATIAWLCAELPRRLAQLTDRTDDSYRVLSIGSGDGEIDRQVLQTLRAHLAPERPLVYHALEPNIVHHATCTRTLAPFDSHDGISVQVLRLPYAVPGGFESRERYDLVLIIHVLYYFQQPLDCITHAVGQLTSSGRVLLVHQTEVGIPELQELHMLELCGNRDQLMTAADVRRQLDAAKLRYEYEEIEAYLDVTECLRGSADGLKILSFCMGCDLRPLEAFRIERLRSSLAARARLSATGVAQLREPLGLFLLAPQPVPTLS